jgi:glycogen synthase
LKYWLLTTEYPPQYGGGIGTYCAQWSSILKQNGVQLTIFVLNKREKKFREVVEDNVRRVEFSPYLKDTSDFLGYETMVSYSFEEIINQYIAKEGPPDWLEAQEYQGIAYFILQKKHLGAESYRNLKILITCHCPSFITFEHNHISTYQLPYFWIAQMEKFCIKAADLCIFPSTYLQEQILNRFPTLVEKSLVLHNPYFVPHRASVDHKSQENDFAIIGKLSPAKGTLATLNLFEKLWQEGYPYRLRLIGDRNYFYHAKNTTTGDLISKRYGNRLTSGLLTVAGALPPVQTQQEIAKTKIILVPSTVENLPYTVIESMAAGKTVLASAQGGQKEIINDGVNGFLFDYDRPSSFEQKVHVTYNLSPSERASISSEAIKTIQDRCDPQSYFTMKLEALGRQVSETKTRFPFVSFHAKEKISEAKTGMKPLLSIVVPYFNMGKYINDAIASIDDSTYPEKEIIIVNDGSTEQESINTLKSLRSRAGIRIIDQENLGLPTARNRGAQEAKGEYLSFLDADDKVSKNYFELAIDILKKNTNVHFVGCWVQYFDGSHNQWPSFNPEPPFLLYHNMINSSSLVYRTASFLNSGLNDSKFTFGMEDYDSVIQLVKNGYYGTAIPEFHFFYRVRKNSMARGFNKSNRLYLHQLLAEKHKEFYATFAAELFGLLNANGPGIFLDNPTLDYHLTEKIPLAGSLSKKIIYLVKKNSITRKMAYKIYRLLSK